MKQRIDILDTISIGLQQPGMDYNTATFLEVLSAGLSVDLGEEVNVKSLGKIKQVKGGMGMDLLFGAVDFARAISGEQRRGELAKVRDRILEKYGISWKEIEKSMHEDGEFWDSEYVPEHGEGYYHSMLGKTYKEIFLGGLKELDFGPREKDGVKAVTHHQFTRQIHRDDNENIRIAMVIRRWKDWKAGLPLPREFKPHIPGTLPIE